MKPILLILALLAAVPVSAQQITLPPVELKPFSFISGSGTALGSINLPSGSCFSIAGDAFICRDAANTLAQRNGTNAQAFNLYNTYTDASNYERGVVKFISNTFGIYAESAGTGTARAMELGTVGATALSFVTTNQGRFQISSSGHLLAVSNNNYDIGASAATSARTIYASTSFKTNAGAVYSVATAAVINTAPSGPVACTSPTVTWSNGTAAFQIDVGGTCAGISTLVVTLPAVTNAWSCSAINVTTSATAAIEMTASTTTTATFTNYTRTTGAVLVWVDGADVRISCLGG